MARRGKRNLATSAASLMLLAPGVAGARLARAAGEAARGRHDSTFWLRLAGEKAFAAQEAWLAAFGSLVEMQQRTLAAWLGAAPTPWSSPSALEWWRQRQIDAETVAAAAMAPLARRVRSNARRAGR